MQANVVLGNLQHPADIKRLQQYLEELYDLHDALYTESAPNGSITAHRGKLAIYYTGSAYQLWQNVDGDTTWQRLDNSLWEIDGSETQLITADEIDMQSKTIKNLVSADHQGDVYYDNGSGIARLTPGTSGYFLQTQGDGANPLWAKAANTSNVIYCWIGSDSALTNVFGMVEGSALNPDMSAYTVNYHFFGVYGSTYRTILIGQFVKIAGISTVTIHARLWAKTIDADTEAILNVDIGGQSNTVKSVTSTTPTWVTTANIDVSGLTNGTVYSITIQLKDEAATASAYCSAVILTAS